MTSRNFARAPRRSRDSDWTRSSTTTRSRSRRFDEPPVLIGHSFGGLIVELLLDRGLGRAGVAMSPAPPKGILVLPFSSLKAASPALAHPSRWHGVVPLTLEEFTFGFVNTFTPEAAADAYERYAVPETRADLLRSGLCELPSAPADRGSLQERRSSAPPHHRSREGQHGPRLTRRRNSSRSTRSPRRRRTTSSSQVVRTS